MINVKGFRAFAYAEVDSFQPEVAVRCLNAAKAYLANAGVKENDTNPLYEQAVYMLAMHYYDNRGVENLTSQRSEVSYGLQSIIHQLVWSNGEYTPISFEEGE